MSIKSFPTFINNSGLPVNLETWQPTKNGFGRETLIYVLVQSGEKVILPSTNENGEWYLQSYLNKEMAEQWRKAGIHHGNRIGKFRNNPCILGNYTWMEYDESPFEIIYNIENETATFIKK
jgi:hypothetical protein